MRKNLLLVLAVFLFAIVSTYAQTKDVLQFGRPAWL